MLWENVRVEIEDGNAIVAWTTNNEAGYEFDTYGTNRRIPIKIDGFPLVSFLPESEENNGNYW